MEFGVKDTVGLCRYNSRSMGTFWGSRDAIFVSLHKTWGPVPANGAKWGILEWQSVRRKHLTVCGTGLEEHSLLSTLRALHI